MFATYGPEQHPVVGFVVIFTISIVIPDNFE